MDVTESDVLRARKIASAFHRRATHVSRDDLFSAALEGLAKAADRYDGRGPRDPESFWRFAKRHVYGAIQDDLRRTDHLSRELRSKYDAETETLPGDAWINPQAPAALDAPLASGSITAVDVLVETRDPIGEAIDHLDLEEALSTLSDRERGVLLAVDYAGVGNRFVAGLLGVTEARVTQIRTRAKEKLRDALGDDFAVAA